MALAFLRRHKRWFYVFLWVVILAFVILYIPSAETTAAGDTAVATVGGREISVASFQRRYIQQKRYFMAMNQGQIDEAMLERMGLRQQVLSSMVRQKIEELEADRLGFTVDDAAVVKAITENPAYQDNGRFVGSDTLSRMLQQQGLTAQDFEREVRTQLKSERLRDMITDGVGVSDDEVTEEFHRRTDLINVEYAFLPTATFAATIQPTEEEIKSRFESNKDRFKLPERRVVSYLLVDPTELRAKVLPTGSEIEAYYRNNATEFTTAEQVCGSHVLIKVKASPTATEGHDDASARTLAEAALARVKAGEPFEKVAKERSEDSSASSGGSLGCFQREAMVKEFSDAAFALSNGATSELVKTQYGYHIIKVDTKVAARTSPLEQVRKGIEQRLQDTRAREMAGQKAEAVGKALESNRSLEQIATAEGLSVKKSEPLQLGRGAGVLSNPALLSKVFSLKPKETDKDAHPAGQGLAFVRLEEVLPPKTPELAEVKDEVRRDAIDARAREQARGTAAALIADARRTDLKKAAERAKATFGETKNLVGRGQALASVPQGAVVEEKVFALGEKTLSDPIDAPAGVLVARVIEKKVGDPTAREQQAASIRESLLDTKRERLFSAYLQSLMERYPVATNAGALENLR
jgi:peptidyl-prolyl cis-trans isomerase D